MVKMVSVGVKCVVAAALWGAVGCGGRGEPAPGPAAVPAGGVITIAASGDQCSAIASQVVYQGGKRYLIVEVDKASLVQDRTRLMVKLDDLPGNGALASALVDGASPRVVGCKCTIPSCDPMCATQVGGSSVDCVVPNAAAPLSPVERSRAPAPPPSKVTPAPGTTPPDGGTRGSSPVPGPRTASVLPRR